MLHYDERIAEQASKVARLQNEWETVVGEIWKVGVACLGEEAMETLLLTKEQRLAERDSLLPSSDADSTFFIPEHSPHNKSRVSKQGVTFLEPKPNYAAVPTSKFPDFLYQPSRYRKDTLPVVSSMSDRDREREIKQLEKSVKDLGKIEIEDFRKIELGQKEYWRKKTAQLTVALKDD
jgi:hypothetical protein